MSRPAGTRDGLAAAVRDVDSEGLMARVFPETVTFKLVDLPAFEPLMAWMRAHPDGEGTVQQAVNGPLILSQKVALADLAFALGKVRKALTE